MIDNAKKNALKAEDSVFVRCGEKTAHKYGISEKMREMESCINTIDYISLPAVCVRDSDGGLWYFHIDDVSKTETFKNKKEKNEMKEKFEGKYKVIINDPAVILFVNNLYTKKTEKYVSKAHNEEFDPEKGLLMCLAKANGISHLELKRMLKGATTQKKSEIKTVEIETENKPESYKEEPKRTYEMAYKRAKSPVGRKSGKPFKFNIGDTVVVRDCLTYFYQAREDVKPMLNKQLGVVDTMKDDIRQYYVVEYKGKKYLFAGCELELVSRD